MDDLEIEAGETGKQPRDARGRLQRGHERIPGSGRPPGKKNWSVRALAEQLSVNPFTISLEILKTQRLPAVPGDPDKKGRLVTTGEYIKVLTEIQSFLAPKVSATQVTAQSVSATASVDLDLTAMMSDPVTASLAQELALKMASQRPQLQAPDPESIEDGPGFGTGVRR